ncbi:MAG: hypothetical protein ACRDHZ_12140 [Ktedonobacteraceae bacterium]
MSMRMFGTFAAVVALAGSMAACSQSGQSSPAAVEPTASTATTPVGSTTATLTVQPSSVDGCKPNQPVVATVSWHSSVPTVKIMVAGPGQMTPHLFSEGGHTGSAKTGDWVVANTKFTIVDPASGSILASYTVGANHCD